MPFWNGAPSSSFNFCPSKNDIKLVENEPVWQLKGHIADDDYSSTKGSLSNFSLTNYDTQTATASLI